MNLRRRSKDEIASTGPKLYYIGTQADESQVIQADAESTVMNNSLSLLGCIRAWWSVSVHSLQVTSLVLFVIAAIFAPALCIGQEAIDSEFKSIYRKFALSLEVSLFYLFVTTFAIKAFGFTLIRQPLFYWYLPLCFGSSTMPIFGILQDYRDFLDILGVVVFGILVRYQKLPANPSIDQRNLYSRKDRLMPPIIRTVGVIAVIYAFLQFIYSAFLEGGFITRMIIRFVVLPSLWTIGSAMQFRISKQTLVDFREYWIPFIWIIGGILKIWERLFTNAMFGVHEYEKFIIVSFTACVFEIVAHATYFHRALFMQNLWRSFTYKTQSMLSRKVRSISLQSSSNHPSRSFASGFTDIELMKMIRGPTIVEDLVIEQEMLIVIPLLMYLSHPLRSKESFGVIQDFRVSVFQIGVQFLFEMLSDICAFYITIHYHGVSFKEKDIPRNDRWFIAKFVFLVWQTIGIFRWTAYAS